MKQECPQQIIDVLLNSEKIKLTFYDLLNQYTIPEPILRIIFFKLTRLQIHELSIYQKLSDEFIRKYFLVFDDERILRHQTLTDKFIEEYFLNINLGERRRGINWCLNIDFAFKINVKFIIKYADEVDNWRMVFYHYKFCKKDLLKLLDIDFNDIEKEIFISMLKEAQ